MIYEICTDTWREAPSLNLARESHSSCTVGTRIYVVCDHETEEGDFRDVDESGQPYVEMLFPGDTAKLIVDQQPLAGHTAALLVYTTHNKKTVVETDTDLLTDDDYTRHAEYVVTSIKDELNT